MSILDKYLKELFWKKTIKLPVEEVVKNAGYELVKSGENLPNPYNFRRLRLDKNVTKNDLIKAEKLWKSEVIEKGFDTTLITDNLKHYNDIRVILDGSKRVGMVGFNLEWHLVYLTWIRGKNYAAAGCMALLNLYPQFYIYHDNTMNIANYEISVNKNNKASLKTVKNLKAKKIGGSTLTKNVVEFEIYAPYWWNNNKLLDIYYDNRK